MVENVETVQALQRENAYLRQRLHEMEHTLHDYIYRRAGDHQAPSIPSAHTLPSTQLCDLLLQLPVALCFFRGPDHVYDMVNDTYCTMIGKPRHALIGKPVREVFPELSGQGVIEQLDQAYESGEPFVGNELCIKWDQQGSGDLQDAWITFICQPLSAHDGQISGMFVMVMSVTERVQAHRELAVRHREIERLNGELQARIADLKQSRAWLQEIIDNASAAIYVKDCDGRYLLCNQRAALNMERSHDDIIGKSDADLFPQEFADVFRTAELQVMATNQPLEREEVLPQDDGLHTYLSVKFPLYDTQGAIYAVGGVSTDITERQRAAAERDMLFAHEQEARAQAERKAAELDTIIRSIPDAVFISNEDGVTLANEPGLRMFGFQSLEELNHNIPRLIEEVQVQFTDTSDVFHAGDTGFNRAMRGESATFDTILHHPQTGEKVIYRSSTAPIVVDDTIIGVVAINTDITRQKRAEQRQRLLADVGGHLIATPDMETMLHTFGRLVVNDLADLCVIHTVSQHGTIECHTITHRDPQQETLHRPHFWNAPIDVEDQHPIAQVLRRGQVLCLGDVTSDVGQRSAWCPDRYTLLHNSGLSAFIGLPLIARGHIIGTLSLARDQSRYSFCMDDLLLSEELARRLALAIDNTRLYAAEQQARRAAEQSADRMARLQQVTASLVQVQSFAQIAEAIVEQGVTALGAAAGCIALLNDDGTTLGILRARGYAQHVLDTWQHFSIDTPLPICTVAQTGQPLWLESREACMDDYPLLEQTDDYSHAWAILPLMTDKRVFGCIVLSFSTARIFAPKDCVFMLTLAQQCSYAMERAHLHEAERQARNQAEAAVHQRDHMLRLISHDLKTPLTTIQGYVRLLQQQAGQVNFPGIERCRRGLSHIEAATARMVAQIQELLDISSLRVGHPLALNQSTLDLVLLMQRIADGCQQMSEQHTIRIDTDLTTLVSLGDEVRLERVFSNLLVNAIKYSPQGGEVIIRIDQEQHHQEGWAVFQVQDRGVGIPTPELPHIFEPFHRASNVCDSFPGTGLGLTSAYQIIKQHGGHMSVNSTVGIGSIFTVKLPLVPTT